MLCRECHRGIDHCLRATERNLPRSCGTRTDGTDGVAAGYGEVNVIPDGAEILKRLRRAMPKSTAHIIDWVHIAMKIQRLQQVADHVSRFRSCLLEALRSVDRDIRAPRNGACGMAALITRSATKRLLARLKQPQGEAELSIARLHSLGSQLLTYIRSKSGG